MRWGVGQILAVPFVDTENTLLSSAENTTEVIKLILLAFCKSAIGLCFQKSAIILPELTSHTLALPSLDEVTILVPSKTVPSTTPLLTSHLKSELAGLLTLKFLAREMTARDTATHSSPAPHAWSCDRSTSKAWLSTPPSMQCSPGGTRSPVSS